MTDKYFVIAGTRQEYEFFIREKARELWNTTNSSISLGDFSFISHPEQLRGHRNPHGWFVGTWWKPEHTEDIIRQLIIATDDNPSKFVKIHRQMLELKRNNHHVL